MESKNNITPLTLTTISNEHIIPLNELCCQLKTSTVRGIKEKRAKTVRKENGKNKFEPPRRKVSSELKQFFTGSTMKSEEKFSKSEWKRIFGDQLPSFVTVIRDGLRKEIFCKNIVIGDLIEMKRNDVVPADIRIIDSNILVVDNRLITGKPCEARTHHLTQVPNDCLVSPNMVYACTKILQGDCVGIVLRTGEETVFGTLKNFATKVKIEKNKRKISVE